jgi:hypothetical protein
MGAGNRYPPKGNLAYYHLWIVWGIAGGNIHMEEYNEDQKYRNDKSHSCIF